MFIGIISLFVLVTIHEWGHFIVAKLCNVQVNKFSIGFGPAIFKKRIRDTLYSIRIIPLGGYCSMEGEHGEDSDNPKSFDKAVWWKKLLIFLAGPVFNFLIGLLIILTLFLTPESVYAATLSEPLTRTVQTTMIENGDKIVKVDDFHIFITEDIEYAELFAEAAGHPGVFDVVIERNGEKIRLEDYAPSGGSFLNEFTNTQIKDPTITDKFSYSLNNVASIIQSTILSIKHLVLGNFSIRDMSGPVGIVSSYSQMSGLQNSLFLTAFISINLGVMNLLPIPALDGGQAIITVLERCAKRKINRNVIGFCNAAFFIAMILLMCFISMQDIRNLF